MIKKAKAQEVLTAGLSEKGKMMLQKHLSKKQENVENVQSVQSVAENVPAARNATIPGTALKKHQPCAAGKTLYRKMTD
ncbi:hypothetical protein D3C86_1666570 [compost metagenome]